MSRAVTRRRFLTVAAAAVALPATGSARLPVARWRGAALGAGASLTLAGVPPEEADPIFRDILGEVARLEAIFSLHRPDSALSRLNATGRLEAPPPDLLRLLSLCDALHVASGGVFDPTVQPLWRLWAQAAAAGQRPASQRVRETLGLVGWNRVRFAPDAIRLECTGMALTLNGVAQGYIADRVADRLRALGLRNVLVDMGEVVALGRRPGGGAWRAGVAAPDGAILARPLLRDRALATSSTHGSRIGAWSHLVDPREGRTAPGRALVSVSAPTAALADGLSTALCLSGEVAPGRLTDRFSSAQVLAATCIE